MSSSYPYPALVNAVAQPVINNAAVMIDAIVKNLMTCPPYIIYSYVMLSKFHTTNLDLYYDFHIFLHLYN